MKTQVKRIVALMLAVAMTISFVGCKRTPQTAIKTTEEAIQSTVELQQATQNMELSAPTEYDRDSMEEIAEMLGVSKEEVNNLDDGQILEKVEELLNETDNKKDKGSKDKSDKTEIPSTNVGDNDENYDEDGAMTKPFDQIYPELVAEGAVEYDEETLLIKMSNSRDGEITKAMSEAGVSLLEAVVPMEKSTWYEAKLFPGADAMVAVKMLRELDEIQMVDFNYVVETNGMADPQAIPEEIEITDKTNNQWHLKYCQYPQGHGQLKKKGGDPSVVVAVIDTGVDYDHEDLAQNIWKNTAEIPDNGRDDDNNGYIDDYYGVNIITRQGNGDDDHGHGTHVAGIIAAQNNKIGVVGLAYNVKIMPIKAGMASGYFNQSDIAKAVLYAYEHGAQVINMSFGGTACSIAVQDALEVAYSRCVLVASAGNDTFINEPAKYTMLKIIPNYPAALSYVIGVMSVGQSGVESGFTNIDGKLYTKTEYEVYAPGEGILSTIPNDQYASWSGTSMAAPIVSAIAAIVRGEYPDLNTYPTKFIYGQITATSGNSAICGNPALHGEHNVPNIINLYEALTKLPTPDVGLYDYALFDTVGLDNDTAEINNGDGVIDAGETFALGLVLRNRWGKAVDTTVTIDTLSPAGIADPYIEIINPTVNYGEVGTYSTSDSGAVYENDMLVAWENPFYIRIKEDCPNDYIFRLNVTITAKNGLDEKDSSTYSNGGAVELTVRSGTVLPSIIEEDMTLTADNLWIIPNGTTILSGVTVIVEPGTHIQFWSNDPTDPYADQYIAGLDVKGRLLVNGTAEDMVYIYPSELMSQYNVDIYTSENGYVSINYADITNFGSGSGRQNVSKMDHCILRQNYTDSFRVRSLSGGKVTDWSTSPHLYVCNAYNTVFYKIGSGSYLSGSFKKCIFADCKITYEGSTIGCVFLGNNIEGDILPKSTSVSNNILVNDYIDHLDDFRYSMVYNKDTGTTYLYYLGGGGLLLTEVEKLGGYYAAIETIEEKEWLDTNLIGVNAGRNWNIYAVYDEISDTYLWSNGEKIADFVDPDGVTVGYKGQTLIYELDYGRKKIVTGSDPRTLFEIPGEIYPEDIFLNSYAVNIDTDSTHQIVVQSTPASEDFIFESSDETVATVDENGLVTPVAKGTADITVYSWDKAVYNYVTVNILDYVALESITLANESKNLFLGENFNVGVKFTPADTTRKDVTYTSSDETVATVDHLGNVTAAGRGTATITATSSEGFEATTTVNVYKKTSAITFDKTVITASVAEGAIALPIYTITDGEDAVLQWKSTDEAVAKIEDGNLVPLKEGTTSVILTDTISGASASVLLYVLKGELSNVKTIASTSSSDYNIFKFLTENGKVYEWRWSANGGVAELVKENVANMEYNIYVMNDGTLHYDYNSVMDTFKDKKIIKAFKYKPITSSGDQFKALMEDGSVYVWGDNSDGALGLGHTNTIDTPQVLNIENVVDITTHGFLCSNGNYYTIDSTTHLPVISETGVSRITDGLYGEIIKDGKILGGSESHKSTVNLDDYELLSFGYNYHLAVKDGKLYTFTGINGNIKENSVFETEAAVVAIYNTSYDYKKIVATNDGLVYLFDKNKLYPIFLGEIEDSNIQVISTNLDAENVLTDNNLILNLNKEISTYSITVYADGVQIPVTAEVKNNTITISRSAGFEAGVNYKLVISSITGAANTSLAEPIEIAFTSNYNASADNGAGTTQIASGTCGETVSWKLDSAGTFTISGQGDMSNVDSKYEIPWHKYRSEIRNVIIENGVTSVGSYSFVDCESLTSVTMPDGITFIGEQAFMCTSVSNVVIPDSVVTIGSRAFQGCMNLIKISIPDSVTSVGSFAFSNCESMEEVVIPNSVTTIEGSAFGECISLKEIVIPENITTIANNAFIYCTALESVTVPSSLTFVGERAFYDCLLLKDVYYAGNETQWNDISVEAGNESFINANIEYNISIDNDLQQPNQSNGLIDETVLTLVGTTVDETVVNKSQTDEELKNSRFYWTIEGFIEELDKAYAKEPITLNFYGNAVLNRISTDTDPANWMRIIAPSTSRYTEVPLGGNYWGTTNETLIGKQIVDYSDYNSYARLLWEKYLTEAPEDVFPFITDVTILDKNGDETRKVGAEEITVKVSFNRDMDTSIPFRATFGSAYPYADYTIEGEYTDPRTWQGTYTVSTLIEGGTSYFNFANGMSATDNLMFCEDTARFSFDIDNTAAQALIMQGYATDSGIQLSWTQDDFDTLMGYNVYRSTSEDGYYQRINSTIIPADTKEFFDDTVEPGIQYYYNFTVVKTDMNESVPSGKITIMSKDTMAPDIYHTPVYNAFTGSNLIISATVTDNLNLSYVRAYYRTTGAEGWNVSVMSKLNDKYSAIIPANDLTLDGIEYYIEAYDGINYTYKGSATSPYAVTIQQAVDATSLGDVNGDGKITNLDALMLLQAINDKLNLTSEQFTRADLDGNGVLQAFEALRILQYVNGTVGSVVIG